MPSSTYIYSNYSNYSTYMYFYIDFRSNMEPRYLTSAVAGSPLGCRHCSQEPDYRWISGIRPCLANLSINHRDLMGYHGHIMGGILPGMIDVESGCCPPRLIWWVRGFSSKTDRKIGESQDQQGIQFSTNQMMGFSSQVRLPTVGYLKQRDEFQTKLDHWSLKGRGNTWYQRWLIHIAMEAAHRIDFLGWLSKFKNDDLPQLR